MATSRSNEAIFSFVEDGTLQLEVEAGRNPDYRGIVVTADVLIVIDGGKVQLHSRHDGKLLAASDELESYPMDMCLISNKEAAVFLSGSTIEIMSFESTHRIGLVKILHVTTGFHVCHSVAKVESMEKLVVSGLKRDDYMFYWCVVNLTDGRVDSTHKICKGYSHLAVKGSTVYISCHADKPSDTGVYSYHIPNPKRRKFLYRHRDLKSPRGLCVDTRDYIYVCNRYSNSIHQLTERGELVTIYRLSSRPHEIFYEEQDGVLYITHGWNTNKITRYRLEDPQQQGVPEEILKMDERSIQLFEEALKDGKETVYHIRVMVVGHLGVGKTTLIKRLLGEGVNISERHCTEGIDVYINCCDASLSTLEWTKRNKYSEQDDRLDRVVRVLNDQQSAWGKVDDNDQVVILPQGETTDSNASVIDEEQVIITHHEEITDINASVTANEQVITTHQEETTDSNPRVTDKEQVMVPTQGVRALKIHDGDHAASEDKDTELLYHHSSQQDHALNISDTNSRLELPSALNQRKLQPLAANALPVLKLLQENADKLKQDSRAKAKLTIMDFAGHYAFYTTHQTFLTQRAIYLLVSNVSEQITARVPDDCYFDSKGIMRCKVHELTEVWLNSIHSCAPSPKASTPPVILVGTHADKLLQVSRDEICKRYFREIRSYLKDKPTRFHLVDEDFAIDNTVVDKRLESLKRKIIKVASQQPYWGEEIPARWILLEQELMNQKADGIKVISLKEVENLNKKGTVRIEKSEELDLFLRYLHETGMIIYFSIEVLRDNIVLDPIWLIDALKSLINAQPNLPESLANNGSQSSNPADNGSQSTNPADNGSQSTNSADNGSQSSNPAENSSQSTSPANNSSQSTRPADVGSQSTSPANNGSQSTRAANNGFQSTTPADNGLQSTSPADNGLQSTSPANYGSVSISHAASTVTKRWSDFKEKGILHLELVDAVWTQEKYSELHAQKDHILLIMEQLNIIAKPRSFSEIGEKVENYFLAPCMLRQVSPKEVISTSLDPRMMSTRVLKWVFTGKFLPSTIFHRLLAACVAHWPVAKKKDTSENLIFCGCCVFELDLFHRLTLYFENHVISAKITRMAIDDVKIPDAKHCSRVRRFITQNLSKITSYLGQNLQYDLHVKCPPSQMWLADEAHDPDSPIRSEHMNHARLCVALVTVCGNALRDILLTQVPAPHTDIYQALLANQANLTTRRQVRPGHWQNALLNQDQIQLVFPGNQGQKTGTVDQFDLSLLYTLIRNISTVAAPSTGWGNDPHDQPRDTSLGASVERIRSYRNHISGHSPDGKLSRQDLEDYWNKFKAVLDDIEAATGRQVYSPELAKQKRQVISIYEAW